MSKILTLADEPTISSGTQVQFYYGKAENAGSCPGGAIYFAYDTTEIYLDGEPYCSGVNDANYDKDRDVLILTLANGGTVEVIFPTADGNENGNDGLLSKADKAKLDALEDTLKDLIKGLYYIDTTAESSFVTAVSETNGIISVLRAELTSEDGTVTIDGYDLHVNVDGSTIVADDDGKLSVASSALTQYVGADAIAISKTDENNEKTVSLVIEEGEKVLSQSESGLKTTLSVDYNRESYEIELKGIDDEVISSFDAREFIIDGILENVTVTNEDDKGDKGKFLELTWIINKEGEYTTKTVYVDVTEMIDDYTAGNGLLLDGYEFSVKIADSDEGYLQSTEAGIKTVGIGDAISTAVATEEARAEAAESDLSTAISAETERAVGVEANLQAAIEAAQAAATTKVDVSGNHLTISSTTASDSSTTYTIGETNIASADDLEDETARATQVEGDLQAAIDELASSTSETTNNIITAVGLNKDGTHDDSIDNHYADGETVEKEISALDTEVYNIVETNLTWHIVD